MGDTITSAGLGVGGGSMYQTFVAEYAGVESVTLRLQAGGSLPASGYSTQARLLAASPTGTVLASATAAVTRPTGGSSVDVSFDLSAAAPLQVGGSYVVEWIQGAEGDAYLTWSYTTGNAYTAGSAVLISGSTLSDWDYEFQVISDRP